MGRWNNNIGNRGKEGKSKKKPRPYKCSNCQTKTYNQDWALREHEKHCKARGIIE